MRCAFDKFGELNICFVCLSVVRLADAQRAQADKHGGHRGARSVHRQGGKRRL